MIITFEGLPLSGKTTQMDMLQDASRKWDIPIIASKEPGWNKETSGFLHYMIKNGNTTPIEKLFLYLADRAGHYERHLLDMDHTSRSGSRINRPILISEGGPETTIAYQGFGAKLASYEFLMEANRLATRGTNPHITFYLKMTVEDLDTRWSSVRGYKLSNAEKEYFGRIVEGYNVLSKEVFPDRIVELDATSDADKIQEAIRSKIESQLRYGQVGF